MRGILILFSLLTMTVFAGLCNDSIPLLKVIENESYRDADFANKIVDQTKSFGEKLLDNFPTNNSNDSIPIDSISQKPLKRSQWPNWWWNRLWHGGINMKDTTVIYPKFLGFCVKVYNWADYVFNSYDSDYVVGTGKRWKFRLVSDNWVDGYSMTLPENLHAWMLSDLYANFGGYLQYMAVSVGYTWDVGKIFHKKEPSHKKFEFGFNCARFNLEIYYNENTGGTNMRRFGNYNNKKIFKEYFPGVSLYSFGVDAYYFFNNKKYSQGAAYNFSKIQKKSQGSFLAGFSYSNLKLNFDFSELPANLKPYLTIPADTRYNFHYNSYAIIFGYGYNWVILKPLLFNVSAMPSLGISHCYEDSEEANRWLGSYNIAGRVSLTYNLGNYFFSLIGKTNGHWFKSGTYSLFSSVTNFSANVGLRF